MSKKNLSKNKKNAERGLGVLLEHMDSKLDIVVEAHTALDRKIDSNHVEFREFQKEVSYKFEMVFDELHLIRNDLKEKVGRDEFTALEKRVAHLEKKPARSSKILER
jgi:hypothetical protein